MSYRPPVMAEKIRAVSAPGPGKPGLQDGVGLGQGLHGQGNGVVLRLEGLSRRVHWSRWACKLSGLSMVRSWPVRLSTRERASRS